MMSKLFKPQLTKILVVKVNFVSCYYADTRKRNNL